MSEPPYTCAVWFLDDAGQPRYELCGDEAEAAERAASIETYTDGPVNGLQRSDGTTVLASQWTVFHDERARMLQQQRGDQERRGEPEHHLEDAEGDTGQQDRVRARSGPPLAAGQRPAERADRRCGKCGTPAEKVDTARLAEADWFERGYLEPLAIAYTVQPCGHTYSEQMLRG
jgi:hypothetical protein